MAGAKTMMITLVALTWGWAGASHLPPYHPPPHYGHEPVYKEPARPYTYSYAVNDDYKGLQFSAGESSNGQAVKGSYQVALPDGRTQNVDYKADHYNGYTADVSYKGYASYPPPAPYHPAPYKPAPAPYKPPPAPYKPAPAPYKPAPAPYKPAPAPYKPAPPVYHPAPYKPRPVYH